MRVMGKDVKEYKRLRVNYQAKIRRIKNKTKFDVSNDLDIDLPNLRDFKKGKAFKTRKDFNNWKKQVEEVTDRNYKPLQIQSNKNGMKYPRYIKNKGEKATKQAQSKVDDLRKQYSELEVKDSEQVLGQVKERELMLKDDSNYGIYRPEKFDIDNFSNPKSVERNIERNLERQDETYYDERQARMRDNFASMFEESDDEEARDLAEKIKVMFPRDFYEMYLQIAEFDFEDYDSESGNAITGDKDRIEIMNSYLEKYINNGLDLSLKDIG